MAVCRPGRLRELFEQVKAHVIASRVQAPSGEHRGDRRVLRIGRLSGS
jgi:hypothetical protein